MQEIFDSYVENSFGEKKQAVFKFKQFEYNYKKYFPKNKDAQILDIGIERGMNARLFEIASCNGAVQLCIYDKKISDFFTIGQDLETFKDNNELIEKINILLNNENIRKNMAKSAYEKSKKYRYTERAKEIIRILNEKA